MECPTKDRSAFIAGLAMVNKTAFKVGLAMMVAGAPVIAVTVNLISPDKLQVVGVLVGAIAIFIGFIAVAGALGYDPGD